MIRPRSQIVFPGATYHLGARGIRRTAIVADDVDRQWFLAALKDVVGRLGWRCQTYCLMTNHYHLLVETPDANLPDGMFRLNHHYAYRFNRRHGFVGHLFEDRFFAELIKDDAQLVAAAQYIDLNPVRAGLCSAPEEWPWSSCAGTLGLRPAPAFLAAGDLLALFSNDPVRARVEYALRLRDAVRNDHGRLPGSRTRPV